MAIRGTRFNIDLEEPDNESEKSERHEPSNVHLVKDITERAPSVPKAPVAPSVKSTTTGFPTHRTRNGISKFKEQRTNKVEGNTEAAVAHTGSPQVPLLDREAMERQQIDMDNKQKLASMSDEEIAREREELLSTLSPAFLEKLLKRSTIEEVAPDRQLEISPPASDLEASQPKVEEDQRNPQKVSATLEQPNRRVTFDNAPASEIPPTATSLETFSAEHDDLAPASFPSNPLPSQFHFPKPEPLPSLNPSDPDFLDQLHEKYFPDLPADPSKLSWMTSSTPDQDSSVYAPTQPDISVSDLRFSFSGSLIAPKTALKIPVTAGLHHHGDAPSSAGYTVPELAHLSRSSFPGQRCVSYQILGRLLYRLGKGQFGEEEGDLASGLWECVRQGRVIETLQQEAGKESGRVHLSAKAYATEALWLWTKGGGRRWDAK
ncbi:MAG: hypothetical protein M1828_003796 [Chrysothrix sp. TS-e1954]|nr:MAG: hypothetical protein M1828_003796 [Chrysothrix sp. TS-e1954]